MSANRLGEFFSLTTFGESHGAAMGALIEGCPAGVGFDLDLLRRELQRRRPGQTATVSSRQEADEPEILSGVYDGKTLGTPILILVRNQDAKPQDYTRIKESPRPGHADDIWKSKFGHVDPRGGGRASGRETVARVMGGAVAQMFLRTECPELRVRAWPSAIGKFDISPEVTTLPQEVEELLLRAKEEGKSYGGVVEIWIDGLPKGLGQPVFHKLKADLTAAIMSVGAVNGVELGDGFGAARLEGSQFHRQGEVPYGGIRGGISTGERVILRASFKPTATVLDEAKRGRHDPCIVPRAIPVVECMVWLTLANHVLWQRLDQVTLNSSSKNPAGQTPEL